MRCLNCYQNGISLSAQICPRCGVHLPSLLRNILPHGTLLRDSTYHLDYALGRGGFGITYQAIHTRTEQALAIKEFYPQDHALREGETGRLIIPTAKEKTYQRGLERFLREAKILAKINHPNVVRVQDFFNEKGTAYLVMELITGNTLREELAANADGKLPADKVKPIIEKLVSALNAVHQQGIYHLDIKPDNILLTPDRRLVLVDFGASRQGLGTGTTLACTPDYAPPELMAAKDIGPESDLFELAMMLHEMLTGKLPPNAMVRILNEDQSWKPEGIEEPWNSLLISALQFKTKKRPQSVQEWWQSAIPLLSVVEPQPTVEQPQLPKTVIIDQPTFKVPSVTPTIASRPVTPLTPVSFSVYWKVIAALMGVVALGAIGLLLRPGVETWLQQQEIVKPVLATLPCQDTRPLTTGSPSYTYSDGTKYYGKWLQVKKGNKTFVKIADGKGTMVYKNGIRYDGEFKDGQRNGCGTFKFASGSILSYIGQFKNDMYNGLGKLTFKNGDQYVGEFKNNNCHGQGTYIFADRTFKSGEWKDDRLVGDVLSCNR